MTLQGLTGVTSLTSGGDYACGLLAGGGPVCWGVLPYGSIPYVTGFAGQPSFNATPSGPPNRQTLATTLRPAVSDLGEYRQVYVALHHPNAPFQPWYSYGGTSWSALTSLSSSAYAGLLPESLSLPIFTDTDLTLLCGSEVYVGYGMYYQDMLDRGRWQKVATLCR